MRVVWYELLLVAAERVARVTRQVGQKAGGGRPFGGVVAIGPFVVAIVGAVVAAVVVAVLVGIGIGAAAIASDQPAARQGDEPIGSVGLEADGALARTISGSGSGLLLLVLLVLGLYVCFCRGESTDPGPGGPPLGPPLGPLPGPGGGPGCQEAELERPPLVDSGTEASGSTSTSGSASGGAGGGGGATPPATTTSAGSSTAAGRRRRRNRGAGRMIFPDPLLRCGSECCYYQCWSGCGSASWPAGPMSPVPMSPPRRRAAKERGPIPARRPCASGAGGGAGHGSLLAACLQSLKK